MSGNRPILKLQKWPVKIAIWENQTSEGKTFHTAKLTVSYKDKQSGEWRDGDYVGERDWLTAAALYQEATRRLSISEPKPKDEENNPLVDRVRREMAEKKGGPAPF